MPNEILKYDILGTKPLLFPFKNTLKCISIGTPKNNKISICSKSKIDYFGCSKIWAHYSLIIMCSNIGTSKTINFPFWTNGKSKVLGVPILKHFSTLQHDLVVYHTIHQGVMCTLVCTVGAKIILISKLFTVSLKKLFLISYNIMEYKYCAQMMLYGKNVSQTNNYTI